MKTVPPSTQAAAGSSLLARADWRFLLPSPQLGDVLVVGEPDPVLLRALPEVGARVDRHGGGSAYDTVVIVRPALEELVAAVAALRPGGQLWAEVSRPPAAWLSQLPLALAPLWVGALRRAGLVDVAAYWVAPDPARAAHLVPVADRAAVRHLAHRSQGSAAGRVKAAALRLVVAARAAPWAAHHVGLVGRKEG